MSFQMGGRALRAVVIALALACCSCAAAEIFPPVMLFGGGVTYPRVDVFDTTPTITIPVTVTSPLVAPNLNLNTDLPKVANQGSDAPLDDTLIGFPGGGATIVNDKCTALTPVGTFMNGLIFPGASCTFDIEISPTDPSGVNDQDFNDFLITATITGAMVLPNGQSGAEQTRISLFVPVRILDPPRVPEPSTILLMCIGFVGCGAAGIGRRVSARQAECEC